MQDIPDLLNDFRPSTTILMIIVLQPGAAAGAA